MTNKEITQSEKICHNCDAPIQGLYCHDCGQKYVEKKVGVKTIVSDFFDDYFTVDSKIIKSILPLLFKPGFLTNEYLAGRRESYVKPFRIYIITSMLFFFFVFMNTDNPFININESEPDNIETAAADSVATELQDSLFTADTENSFNLSFDEDSTDNSLLGEFFVNQAGKLNDMNGDEIASLFSEFFKRNLPRAMFIILPVIAAILKLFFWRQRKYYIEHFIFSLHLHSFGYILSMISMFKDFLMNSDRIVGGFNEGGFGISVMDSGMDWVILLLILLYLILSMRRVYNQKYRTIILKFIGISFLYLVVLLITVVTMAVGTLFFI
ncbi:MAG: DUF3667 domain-containing protein [Candidatus Marinimicrobia bacterium]|nr:DUF3667 domain-containing protein [Candidatus Neomarinimicrobiota bacterium]MBT3633077.1 DUF3667 domain-containing protein [Candidatus Neomarinimicrobiota bacterium]MBT3682322.1 DUF3667 domain-containing protein [Candidatus Neomarinimicrobiota bacterium]MBT3758677.1 DUF3667 domain-containing protein [Candidatus Neomarinimicrobiota bacterium]MBT3895449.1 DUF3667 domain-containing protein [Candidatus Neomarinimicrobiota bacterium]